MLTYQTVRRFLAPDDGASVQTGASSTGQPSFNTTLPTPADPFAGIKIDDLDPDTKAVLEASRQTFASLQTQLAEEKKSREKSEALSRQFQSKHDAVQAKLDQIAGAASGQAKQPSAEDQQLAAVEKVLIDKGVPPEQAKIQAPVFASMFGVFSQQIKSDIGRDLAPFGASVMQSEASRAWTQAESLDKLGALKIPEVREKVWAGVQELAQSGQAVTAQTVINLRNIYAMEHQENGGQLQQQQINQNPQQQMPQQSQFPSFGPPPFSGGGHVARQPVQQDPNPARHTLNADTAAALAKVTAHWPKPKAK